MLGPDAVTSGAVGQPAGSTPAESAELVFDGVSQYFVNASGQAFLAVKDIDLSIRAGTFVSIIGPSGCGKSTLLNMAAGLLTPSIGQVIYQSRPIVGVNTDVGYMTQDDLLLPWRTVRKNIELPLEIAGVPRHVRSERCEAMLELVGLSRFANHYPSQLSGGMRKRTSLARVLMYEPRVLLMDEPFAALDAQMRIVMQRELLQIWNRDKKSVLFVTHDIEEAILLADVVVVFSKSPGRIVHVEHINFPRPRELTELRLTPEFTQVWERLWGYIEDQMAGDDRRRSEGKATT